MKKVSNFSLFSIVALIMLVVFLCLCGCSRRTPVETAFKSVENSIVSLEKTLPETCKTEEISEKIGQIRLEKTKAQSECERKIQEYKTKYERVLSVTIIIVLLLFFKFFYKKQ